MLMMIWVNDFWTLSGVPAWLKHAAMHEDRMGLSDWVFPGFLFIVGLSIPFAVNARKKKGNSNLQILKHILTRSFALIIMGFFMVNLENINVQLIPFSRYFWQLLMATAMLLIWNTYSDNKALGKIPAWIMQSTGILILVYLALTLPFTIWFLTLYFNGIPQDFEDAALIDGCSRFQALARVVLPMALPGLVAAAAFAFMTSYNEFLFARFLTQSIATHTGPVIISSIAGNPDASYSLISVAMTLGLIPPLILALVLRRWLTEGLSTSVTFR